LRINVEAGLDAEAPRLQLIQPLLSALEGDGVLLYTQLHRSGDGLTLTAGPHLLVALLMGGRALEVLDHDR
jgi:hypothetical protein